MATRQNPLQHQRDRDELRRALESEEQPVQAVMPLGPGDLKAIAQATRLSVSAVKALMKVQAEGGWSAASGMASQEALRVLAEGARSFHPTALKARAQDALADVGRAVERIRAGKMPFSRTDAAIAEHVTEQHVPRPESPTVKANRAVADAEAPPSAEALRKRVARDQVRRDAELEARKTGEQFVDELNADRKSIAGQQAREIPLHDKSSIRGRLVPGGKWPFDERAYNEIAETEPGSRSRKWAIAKYNPATKVHPVEGGQVTEGTQQAEIERQLRRLQKSVEKELKKQ